MSKECPNGYIMNPKTNRCVKKTGKIGLSLVHHSPVKTRSPSPSPTKPDLPLDVLELIANKTSPKTKRNFKMASKHFNKALVLSPSYGQKNGEYFIKALRSGGNFTLFVGNTTLAINHQYKKITLIRNKSSDVPKIIGVYTYEANDMLDDIKILSIIKNKNDKKYVSKILKNLTFISTLSKIKIIKDWKDFVHENNKNLI